MDSDMPKSQLRLKPHNYLPGEQLIEIWWDGKFIGTVTGADGPGIRVISKYQMRTETPRTPPVEINVMETRIECGG